MALFKKGTNDLCHNLHNSEQNVRNHLSFQFKCFEKSFASFNIFHFAHTVSRVL